MRKLHRRQKVGTTLWIRGKTFSTLNASLLKCLGKINLNSCRQKSKEEFHIEAFVFQAAAEKIFISARRRPSRRPPDAPDPAARLDKE